MDKQRPYYAQTVTHIIPLADDEPWFAQWYGEWQQHFRQLA
jgi:hypothetical protein